MLPLEFQISKSQRLLFQGFIEVDFVEYYFLGLMVPESV